MADGTKIEWCDATFNPWLGCRHATYEDGDGQRHVHQACVNCYAEALVNRYGKAKWGEHGTRVMTSASYWKQPLKWNRQAEKARVRKRVFCASLADVFEQWDGAILNSAGLQGFIAVMDGGRRVVSWHRPEQGPVAPFRPLTMDDLRRELFALIDATPWLDWLILTKRPENVPEMLPWRSVQAAIFPGIPGPLGEPRPAVTYYRPNVWFGTSVSDQATAGDLLPALLNLRKLTPVLFASAEPLLGPIERIPQGIDWIIAGGESGPRARPMHPQWVRALRNHCVASGVAFHFKQWGEWWPASQGCGGDGDEGKRAARIDYPGRDVTMTPGLWGESDERMIRLGKKSAGRLLDGREWNQFPRGAR